jgi:tetratricopeptide (TPR) repeat protein
MFRYRTVIVAILASLMAGLIPALSHAQTPPAATHPWESAAATLKATEADLKTGGILGVRSHVDDLEQALAQAGQSFGPGAFDRGTAYFMADGLTEMLLAMTSAAAAKDPDPKVHKSVAIANPYPTISFYLGSYYNEIGRPADALRVLDAGLALPTVMGLGQGEHRPYLMSERGAALIGLKRMPEALTAYDEGLKLPNLQPLNRARLQRGRGFALTELGRLDEAEAAYRESLNSEPGNARAVGELQYIAGLRAGKPATATVITMPNAPGPKSAPR